MQKRTKDVLLILITIITSVLVIILMICTGSFSIVTELVISGIIIALAVIAKCILSSIIGEEERFDVINKPHD